VHLASIVASIAVLVLLRADGDSAAVARKRHDVAEVVASCSVECVAELGPR